MAKDIHVQGIDLDDVPAIDIPLQTSGTARFYDCVGTKSITQNGSGIDVKGFAAVDVNVSGGGGTPNLQTKSVTPTESAQTITADAGYDGLEEVDVVAVSSSYVGSAVTRRSSSDLTASGATVTVPAGFYESQSTKSVSTATHASPTASVNSSTGLITASHTQTAGYVSAGTTTGATQLTVQAAKTVTPSTSQQTAVQAGRYTTGAVTVAAIPSEYIVPTGNKAITANGNNIDVAEYATVSVNVPGGGGSGPELLATYAIGTVSTSSTQATNLNKSFTVSDIHDYDLLICECSVDSVTNNRHTATARLIWLTASSTVGTKNGTAIATATWNSKISSSAVTTTRSGTTAYGVYANSCTISGSTATIALYSRYNSTSTGTINGSYTARVYGMNIYDLIGG